MGNQVRSVFIQKNKPDIAGLEFLDPDAGLCPKPSGISTGDQEEETQTEIQKNMAELIHRVNLKNRSAKLIIKDLS